MHTRSHNLRVTSDVGWFSQVSRGNLALSLRRWDYSSIFISIGVNRLCVSIVFVLNKALTKKDEIFVFICMPFDL